MTGSEDTLCEFCGIPRILHAERCYAFKSNIRSVPRKVVWGDPVWIPLDPVVYILASPEEREEMRQSTPLIEDNNE